MEPTPLRAVTVDLWNTLVYDSEETGKARALTRLAALRATCDALGWGITTERLELAYERCGVAHARVQESGRDLTADEHVATFLELLAEPRAADPGAFAQMRTAYVESVRETPPLAMPGAHGLLTLLRGAGLRLALISNAGRTCGAILRGYLQQLGLASYFETLIFSDEVGLAKPNPAIFSIALGRLGALAGEVVHIGDDLVLDYEGARRSGLRALIIRPERPADLEPPHQWAPDLASVPEKLWVGRVGTTPEHAALGWEPPQSTRPD